ncbi:hypothetical protein F8M41_011255 [Gigaspora margarita]|uniref:Uncharacterized protein n=1 Tax=Gigaspora margarita TaxID=4874 RepID=A0A8H4A1R4_GIGMA|nr:hypothetical protein F8M41_011255 [Gigaspora margarita]
MCHTPTAKAGDGTLYNIKSHPLFLLWVYDMSQPQPLKLNAIPSISQTLLRLPIPRPSVPIKHSEMLSSNWPPSTPDFMINSANQISLTKNNSLSLTTKI